MSILMTSHASLFEPTTSCRNSVYLRKLELEIFILEFQFLIHRHIGQLLF